MRQWYKGLLFWSGEQTALYFFIGERQNAHTQNLYYSELCFMLCNRDKYCCHFMHASFRAVKLDIQEKFCVKRHYITPSETSLRRKSQRGVATYDTHVPCITYAWIITLHSAFYYTTHGKVSCNVKNYTLYFSTFFTWKMLKYCRFHGMMTFVITHFVPDIMVHSTQVYSSIFSCLHFSMYFKT